MVEAVKDGQADALIQSDISLSEDFRVVGRFSPTPYYFALAHGQTALLQELNVAMQGLQTAQPNLQNELYDLYFTYTDSFLVSQEHRDYISSLGTLKVLFFSGDAPYQYVRKGTLTGFAVEYLNRFAAATGLQYEPVVVDTYEEALALVEEGQVDLVACVASNSSLASLEHVRFTVPFFNSFSVTACANSVPHEHGADLPFQINTEQALREIQAQENDGVRADYYSLTYYLRKEAVYDKVVVDWANIKNFSYTVGVTDSVSSEFVALLNQYASSLSSDTRQAMLYRYSGDDIQYTPLEWLEANRFVILGFSLVLLLLVAAFLIYFRNRKIRYKALLAENRLMYIKMYDQNTGAYNEAYFRKLLAGCCARREPMALVAFNIRGFKYINDTYGTKQADNILLKIKTILESGIQDGEFFCRPSADLFFVALKVSSPERLITRTEALFSRITGTAPTELNGHPLSLYSGAVFTKESPSPYQVDPNINYMMVALAHAKQINARTVYIFDEPLYRVERLRYYIETHMHTALTGEEFQVYLQPKIDLRTGCVDGAEALVRWLPKDGEMICPDQFIPLFEENGFCSQLDLYMVEHVCSLLRSWMDQGIPPIVISVNQTKSLFMNEGYVDKLLAITGKYGISPRYIILEIPEGLSFENVAALNRTILRLNGVGFRVSMDDFGSGYSSLSTLGKLKIDELKLDRMFLMDVVNEQKGAQSEVLAAVLALAKKLRIKTVAEGIETKAGEDLVRAMSCDYGQGYYYSRPVPARTFLTRFLIWRDLCPAPAVSNEL